MKLLAFIIIALLLDAPSAIAQFSDNELSALTTIKSRVRSKRVSSYDRSGDNGDNLRNIPPGEKRTIFQVTGAGMINHIWMTLSPEPNKLSRNDVIIRMYWDEHTYPSVESPIGPFFGQGWNDTYLFTSAPLLATPVDGMGLVSYFAMPFAKGARIEIENQSGNTINALYYYIDYIETDKLPPNTGRFHAWYNKALTGPVDTIENEHWMFGPNVPNKTGKDNYLIANITGKGHFVGVNYYVHSPTPLWYGEGDDMIFIDGDTTPTLHGTGTEDYFNTSWGMPKTPYATPYFGYAKVNNEMGYMGRTHLYRFNIADPIYFDRSLRFTIEHGSTNVMTLDLASVAYWYQTEAVQIPAIPGPAARKPQPLINGGDIHRWRQAWRKGKDPKTWGN